MRRNLLKISVLLVAAIFPFTPQARADVTPSAKATTASAALSPEDAILTGLLRYCIAPVVKRQDVAQLAIAAKLVELAPEQAQPFTQGDGRAFIVPETGGNAILIAYASDALCTVMVRRVEAGSLLTKADSYFNASTSPFKTPTMEVAPGGGGTIKRYLADVQGLVEVQMTVRDTYRPTGAQAALTAGRIANPNSNSQHGATPAR